MKWGGKLGLDAISAPGVALGATWSEFLDNGTLSFETAQTVPLEWSDSKNVVWSVEVPGYGQSSPVATDTAAFTTSVEGKEKESIIVISFRLDSGELAWSRRTLSSQRIADSDAVSKAASSPAIDGNALYCLFETGNVLAYSPAGNVLWEHKLTEDFGGRHGIGSSLRLSKAGVLVLIAHDRPSYLICLDPSDGSTVWKKDREEGTSWTTPTVVEIGGQEAALVCAGDAVEAYSTADGSEHWTIRGLEGLFIPSPTPTDAGSIIGSSQKGYTLSLRFGESAYETPTVA